MRRNLKARLDRRVAWLTLADEVSRDRRNSGRRLAAMVAAVRWWLSQMGIDSARAVVLPVADEAAAQLAAIPDGEELRRAGGHGARDKNEQPRHGYWLDADTARLVERYRSGELADPKLDQASLAELFAWCIARNAGSDSPLSEAIEAGDVCC